MQTDNPNAPDYDWRKDREWFNQRLANARIHNSELEQKIAKLRAALHWIAESGRVRGIAVEKARQALGSDNAGTPKPSRMCPECHACGGPDGVTNCATCRGDFWNAHATENAK